MAFELPALPNFQTNIPQMPSALETYGRMLQLKALQGQQQLLPLEVQQRQQAVQASTLENQQRQLELSSQQAMMKAWSDPDFLKKFTGTDKAGSSGLGFDPDALSSSLISQGVLPKDAMAMTQQFVERSAKIADTQKAIAQTGEANAAQQEKGFKVLGDAIGGILDAPASKAGDLLAQLKQDLVRNPKKFSGVSQQDLAHVFSADLEHLPAIANVMGLNENIANYHKAKAGAAAEAQKVIPEGGGLSPDQQQQLQREVALATNPQVQQNKIAVAEAEGRARQMIEGAVKPVYAIDPQGNKTLMSEADALRAGVHTILPVTEKQISDDTMLTNRLGDVRQKMARYEQTINQPISLSDKNALAQILGEDKFKLGISHIELPVDFLNKIGQAYQKGTLSPAATQRLVSYYNAREAMVGYQRVLSGSGRSNEKSMELNLQTLPDPLAPSDYAKESLKQFKENLGIVGQGLPKIPGVKSPEDWEREVTNPQGGPSSAVQSLIDKYKR